VPSGNAVGGLPFGLQMATRLGYDETLFAWASQIEEVL
jgi:Asp-tRNA(Asn)/Glu-tRNA(Gln) amidotransferase A subunit family amidase